MPYCDLPFRREGSAPIFDPADPCSIWRYFEDLDILFIRHHVSDDSEKKKAAVKYPATKVERLWNSTHSFRNPACSYGDFKAEVIQLYPEVSEVRQYTNYDLERFVSNCARTQIYSVQEFGTYYRGFLLISRYLVNMGRIGVQEEARYFLAGFERSLASDILSQLNVSLPDHCPLDPYRIKDIYDAAVHIFDRRACEHPTPPLPDTSPPFIPTPSHPVPPQATPTFPPTPECPSFVEAAPVPTAQAHSNQQRAPLDLPQRDDFSQPMSAQELPLPSKQAPHTVEPFFQAQAHWQASPVSKTSKSSCLANACVVQPPRHIMPPPATPPSIQTPPRSADALVQARTTPFPALANTTAAKSKTLFQVITTPKATTPGARATPLAPETKPPMASKASARPHIVKLQGMPQVSQQICTRSEALAVPVPVEQRRTRQRPVDVTGAPFSSSGKLSQASPARLRVPRQHGRRRRRWPKSMLRTEEECNRNN